MLSDFQMIVHKLPSELPFINIYPIGDVHIGSKECDIELLQEWINIVKDDPFGYAVIIGDMMNMGLKNSKSNVYEEVLNPLQQKELCYELLKPIKHKILAGCSGNHEARMVKEVGDNPLYDVFCRLQIEDVYRENACFIKVNLGQRKSDRQVSYGIVLTHGSTRGKDERWVYAVDNCDLFINGHTHNADHQPLGKIRMDLHNECVRTVSFQNVVVVPFQQYGGYALRGKFLPNHLQQFQKVRLSGDVKRIGYCFE